MTPKTAQELEVEIVKSIYAQDGHAYFTSNDITLDDYATEWKNKLSEIQKRYKYLEMGRTWILKNLKNHLKK